MWMLIIQQPITLFILSLCLSLSQTSSPICPQTLSNRPLSLSHSHCLTVLFFLTVQEMSAPAVVLTIWLGNERKWEFICFRHSQGREESNLSNPRIGKQRILAISAGWGEITTNEHMDCSTMKLSCSHAAIKQKTLISVAISLGKELVNQYFVLYFCWILIHMQTLDQHCILSWPHTQVGRTYLGWQSVQLIVFWPYVTQFWPTHSYQLWQDMEWFGCTKNSW